MTPQQICVFGNTACAWDTAARLRQAGLAVILATPSEACDPREAGRLEPGPPPIETLSGVRLDACRGGPGHFDLVFSGTKNAERLTAAALVVATADERRPNFERYALEEGPSVLSLSDLLRQGCRPAADGPAWRQVVFLNGLATESHPLIAGEVMAAALRLQAEAGAQCTILTGNLKVAAEGLEALAREARAAGVLFCKFANTLPAFTAEEQGRVRIRFVDEPTGEEFTLTPDLVVVDETIRPSGDSVALGRVLGLESDPAGYLQADNVHRLPTATNRRGVVVAGPARAFGPDPAVEASNAVLDVLTSLATGDAARPTAEIEPGRCIRCLTCFRLCPYQAVALDERPRVVPAACEGCGICAAECPREAIRLPGLERKELHALIASERPGGASKAPRIVAFACARSAGPATRAAAGAGHRWPASLHLVEVPCAGSLAAEVILSAFGQGADGVLVLTCHGDNCHSRHGNRLAQLRVDEARAFLDRAGIGSRRLVLKTLAANMPAELAATVMEFSQTLADGGRDAGTTRTLKGNLP
jgi:coenzyme F420-reducing hydrogenase delta subunit/Pyruvate/2-oxoacid:ferredoxin oxidoreductase delta subunit